MFRDPFIAAYAVMLFFQTLHILEEIRFGGSEEVGSLDKYLLTASILVFLYFFPLFVVLANYDWGFYAAFLPALLSIGNGPAHIYSLIKNRAERSSIALGIFNGLFLTITGIWVFITILNEL